MPSKSRHGGSGLCNNHSCVEIPSLVHQTNITLGGCSCAFAEESQSATPPTTDRHCPSHQLDFRHTSLGISISFNHTTSHSHLTACRLSGKSFKVRLFRRHYRRYHCLLVSQHTTSIRSLLEEVGCVLFSMTK